MSRLRYRADLDGLRAVAIAVVVLYHAGVGCPGGFVGVDVFFVLSGFLITALIAPDLAENRFNLAAFWERRVRRLAPALVVLVVSVLVAGWFVLLPDDYRETAQSAVAHTALAANVYFWREAGYFAATSETKPLLHLWSLAIEEQFYLLMPPALMVLRAAGRRLLPFTTLLMGLSLGWSIWSTSRYPDAAYYLLPARAWELLLGVNLALVVERLQPRLTTGRRELLAFAGVAALGYAVFTFSAATPFPGAAALIPCGGAAALVLANSGGSTSIGRVLSLGPATWLGQVSYSVYLWHWPLIALLTYAVAPLSASMRIGVVIASLVLGAVSCAVVERPFRERRWLPSRREAFAGFAMATLVILTAGLSVHASRGVLGRFNTDVLQLADAKKSNWRSAAVNTVSAGQVQDAGMPWLYRGTGDHPRLAVVGDSHAAALMPLLATLCREYEVPAVAASRPATAPLFFGGPREADDKRRFQTAVLEKLQALRPEHVLLVARWSGHRDGVVAADNLRQSVEALRACGATVWILEQVPEQKGSVPRALALARHWGISPAGCCVTRDEHRRSQSHAVQALAAVRDSAHLLDPCEFFFADGALCRIEVDGQPLFADDDHLSEFGAQQLRPVLQPLMAALTKTVGTEVPATRESADDQAGRRSADLDAAAADNRPVQVVNRP